MSEVLLGTLIGALAALGGGVLGTLLQYLLEKKKEVRQIRREIYVKFLARQNKNVMIFADPIFFKYYRKEVTEILEENDLFIANASLYFPKDLKRILKNLLDVIGEIDQEWVNSKTISKEKITRHKELVEEFNSIARKDIGLTD